MSPGLGILIGKISALGVNTLGRILVMKSFMFGDSTESRRRQGEVPRIASNSKEIWCVPNSFPYRE